ncbi:metallophosphoesterase [Engelhardtia mirabilis]
MQRAVGLLGPLLAGSTLTLTAQADVLFSNQSSADVYMSVGSMGVFSSDIFVPAGGVHWILSDVTGLALRARTDLDPFLGSGSYFDYEGIVYGLQNEGVVALRSESTPWLFGGLYLSAIDGTGVEYATSDAHRSDTVRNVKFLGSADCQFYEDQFVWEEIADATHQQMFNLLGPPESPAYRGIVMAGDLTQNARSVEFDAYLDSLIGLDRFVFDSVGNHDLLGGGLFTFSNPLKVIPNLTERNRVTSRSMSSAVDAVFFPMPFPQDPIPVKAPHYSWDWHDVHFVQLGLAPGMGDSQGTIFNHDGSPLPTYDSLAFLQADLLLNVGTSGRPVVLIHHYHLASEQEWCGSCSEGQHLDISESERLAYWEVLQPYNVAAILSGHVHTNAYHDKQHWKYNWADPTPAGSMKVIPNYILGAARGSGDEEPGSFVDWGVFAGIEMNAVNQLRLTRYSASGYMTTGGTDIVSFGDDILHVADLPPGSHGYGTSYQPFPDPRHADEALATRFPGTAGMPNAGAEGVQLSPGSYAGSMKLTQKAKWTSNGGAAVLGVD